MEKSMIDQSRDEEIESILHPKPVDIESALLKLKDNLPLSREERIFLIEAVEHRYPRIEEEKVIPLP